MAHRSPPEDTDMTRVAPQVHIDNGEIARDGAVLVADDVGGVIWRLAPSH